MASPRFPPRVPTLRQKNKLTVRYYSYYFVSMVSVCCLANGGRADDCEVVIRSLTMWGYLDSTTNAARLPMRAHYAWISRLTPCRRFSYGRSSLMLFNS